MGKEYNLPKERWLYDEYPSLIERDELIKKLLDVAGVNESDKNKLISS